MYRCSVRSTLTYACKTWPFTEKQERRLLVSDRRLIRKTVRVRWFIVTRTTNAYRTAKNWSYWISWDLHQKNGRVMFIDSKRHLRQELSWNKNQNLRPQGLPTSRFQDILELDCNRVDYLIQDIEFETVEADRTCWRKFVRAATGDRKRIFMSYKPLWANYVQIS